MGSTAIEPELDFDLAAPGFLQAQNSKRRRGQSCGEKGKRQQRKSTPLPGLKFDEAGRLDKLSAVGGGDDPAIPGSHPHGACRSRHRAHEALMPRLEGHALAAKLIQSGPEHPGSAIQDDADQPCRDEHLDQGLALACSGQISFHSLVPV